jgi:hypothetical protein
LFSAAMVCYRESVSATKSMEAVLPEDVAKAVTRGESQSLLAWLDRGGNVDCRDAKGRTVLMLGNCEGFSDSPSSLSRLSLSACSLAQTASHRV